MTSHGMAALVLASDASHRDGRSGLAVTGALGQYKRFQNCSTSRQAEILAIEWAMQLADEAGAETVTFQTDCELDPSDARPGVAHWRDLARLQEYLTKHPGWRIKWIPRAQNAEANRLARRAREAA